MTTSRWITVVTAGALFVAACSGGDDSADDTTTTAEATTTTTSTISPTTTRPPASTSTTTTTLPPVFRQPLSGQPVESEDELLDRPALAVKIDNHPAARRNHSGLAVADIVYEEIVEGQITRFLAIFHSQGSEQLGPIRSGREQDPPLVAPYNTPLFAWSGGNPGVTRLIANSDLVDLNAGFTSGYYRGSGSGPHNLYSDSETLWAKTPDDHPGPPPPQFVYLRPEESFDGEPVGSVDVRVGSIAVRWEWDDESTTWLRSQGGTPHDDAIHGRIAAANIVVMGVRYGRSSIDAASPEAETVGSGPAYVFSDGQLIEGEWARIVSDASIEFFDLDGEPIAVTPGNTWIELASDPPPIEWFPPG